MENSNTSEKTLLCRLGTSTTQGRATLREFSTSERAYRAGKALAGFWGAALVAVFIPILHFVLVPAFLLLGFGIAISIWLQKTELVAGTFDCPSCQTLNSLDKQVLNLPKSLRCSNCYMTLKLEEA